MVAEASEFIRRLPPTSRDFEAFRLTTVEGLSTREAAEQMRLSQTRVVQLRDRALDWMAAELPRLETAPPEQRLAIAEYLAVERMQFLYGASLSAWRQSQGRETVERKSGATGDVSTIVRTSHGNIRYLQQALRIAKELGNFPIGPSMMAAAEFEEEEHGESATNPPDEDCSAKQATRLRVAGSDAEDVASNGFENSTYENCFSAANVPQARENRPVQPAETGSSSPAMPVPPLNRHERRARQRRLEKGLKRKAK